MLSRIGFITLLHKTVYLPGNLLYGPYLWFHNVDSVFRTIGNQFFNLFTI